MKYQAEYLTKAAVANHCDAVMQVGDFGYWPRSKGDLQHFYKNVNKMAKKAGITWYWIDGNHEDYHVGLNKWINEDSPVEVLSNLIYMPRGSVATWDDTKVLFLGGASSIDKGMRLEGWDWFPEEMITWPQANKAIDAGRVDVMFTHDMPTVAFESVRGNAKWILADSEGAKNRGVIQAVLENAQPQILVHGHMHYNYELVYKNTEIVGLHCHGKAQWIILDLNQGKIRRVA